MFVTTNYCSNLFLTWSTINLKINFKKINLSRHSELILCVYTISSTQFFLVQKLVTDLTKVYQVIRNSSPYDQKLPNL